ncbi:MAG TPA: dTMP kinase [Thermoplasmata archaeon]|nr:dTMP kinase [Thermoplasmata archaeon]
MTRRGDRAGLLVVLEGIDGGGKSTLRRAVAAQLRRSGYAVGVWDEPTDPAIGREAERFGRHAPGTAAFLFTLDRALARPRLEREIAAHDVTVSDRSFYSTLAYQGSAMPPRERAALVRLQRRVARRPDLVILLALPARVAAERIGRRRTRAAPLEERRTLERVARAYAALAKPPRWVVLDAARSPSDVARRATAAIRRRLGRPRRAGRA